MPKIDLLDAIGGVGELLMHRPREKMSLAEAVGKLTRPCNQALGQRLNSAVASVLG